MLKIYLDNCVFNRPFDDQGQIRIKHGSLGFCGVTTHVSPFHRHPERSEGSRSPRQRFLATLEMTIRPTTP